MKEIWKSTNFTGYDVSNLGRVRSYWNNRYLQKIPQKILKSRLGNHGYVVVALGRDNLHGVHRLVLEAFNGKPDPGNHGAHNNGIKTDNRLSNLRWDTPKGNASDRDKHGTRWVGDHLPNAKLSTKLAKEIRAEYSTGKTSQRKLADKYGVSQMTIQYLLVGKTWGGCH